MCTGNVLWSKNEDAAKAMITLSTQIIEKEKREDKAADEAKGNKDDGEDNVVMAVDDDEGNEEGEICDVSFISIRETTWFS